MSRRAAYVLVPLLGLGSAGCALFPDGTSIEEPREAEIPTDERERAVARNGTIGGDPRGFLLTDLAANRAGDEDAGGGGGGIGVNGYLWRASLQAIEFLPLASADPFGGVIITDWYAPPETPDERFKLTVYITDTRLRADGVSVAAFRQTRDDGDAWRDAPAEPDLGRRIEDRILTRARELRTASAG